MRSVDDVLLGLIYIRTNEKISQVLASDRYGRKKRDWIMGYLLSIAGDDRTECIACCVYMRLSERQGTCV